MTLDTQTAAAKSKANDAYNLADTKATAEESVNEVRNLVFEVYDKNGSRLGADLFRVVQGDDGWSLMFCAVKPAQAVGEDPTSFCLKLAYVTESDFTALKNRVTAIEQKLGIS